MAHVARIASARDAARNAVSVAVLLFRHLRRDAAEGDNRRKLPDNLPLGDRALLACNSRCDDGNGASKPSPPPHPLPRGPLCTQVGGDVMSGGSGGTCHQPRPYSSVSRERTCVIPDSDARRGRFTALLDTEGRRACRRAHSHVASARPGMQP